MAKTYLTSISNGTGNTECLKAFADCSSCFRSLSAALLDCDCSTYSVSPASVLEANRLDFLNLLIYIKTSILSDLLCFFDRSNAIAV